MKSQWLLRVSRLAYVLIVGSLLILTIFVLSIGTVTTAQRSTRTPRSGGNDGSAIKTSVAQTSTAIANKLKNQTSGTITSVAATASALVNKAKDSVAQTSTAFSQKVAPTLTAFAVQVQRSGTVPPDQAGAAISSYAQAVLGTSVTVTKAGGVTADITRNVLNLPSSVSASTASAKMAVVGYGASLSNGGALLYYGIGKIYANVEIEVQDQSLGVYSLVVNYSGAMDANTALTLAKNTFPSVASMPYQPYTVNKGYGFYANSTTNVINRQTLTVTTNAQAVIFYVVGISNGKYSVTATVGRGQYAATVRP